MFIKGCIFWVVNKLPSLFSLFHYCYYYYYYWKLGNESDYFTIWQGLHFKFQNCFLLCLVLNKMHLEYDLEFKLYWSCKSWEKKYLYLYPWVCKSSTGFTFSGVYVSLHLEMLMLKCHWVLLLFSKQTNHKNRKEDPSQPPIVTDKNRFSFFFFLMFIITSVGPLFLS